MIQENQQDSKTITVFGSGHPRSGDVDYEEARLLGQELARHGYQVCTGGYGGVMEAALRGAKEAGGRTLAVTTTFFRSQVTAYADDERIMGTWQERLFELIRAGQGYVACKGGTGTLAELAVVWEMLNKGVIAGKPMVAFGDFWEPVVERVVQGESDRSGPRGETIRSLIQFAPDARAAAELIARSVEAISRGGARATSL